MDNNIIDEIRKNVDIVEIISDYLPLINKGKNFFGVCPFHDDTNPSMSVSREKQIYKCFSCGASGNVFNFLMDYEHISFKEALIFLSNKTNIKIEGLNINNTNKFEHEYKIYELANKFYQNNLNTNLGLKALKYLEDRQINKDLIKEFKIGLSLRDNGLVKLLAKKDILIKQLENLGLANNSYDVFNNRITFPLSDINGHIVGFSGRIYDNSDVNKYLNTKETPIFKKGSTLYNYSNSKDYIRKEKAVIVMEGFMDVIRASSIGIKNVVALMGTAMTAEQANLIKRLSNNVILCFDGDKAGINATNVNGEILNKLGCNVKVISLEDSLDPDTYILKNKENSFKELIDSAVNFGDYKIKNLKKGKNLLSLDERVLYINLILKEAAKIPDIIKRELLLKSLAKDVDISYNSLEKRLQELEGKTSLDKKITPIKVAKDPQELQAMKTIIFNMFENDFIIRYFDKKGINFSLPNFKYLAMEILSYYKKRQQINLADFLTYLNDKEELLILLKNIIKNDYPVIATSEELLDLINCLNKNILRRTIKNLKKQLRDTTLDKDKQKLLDEIINLKIGSGKIC